MARTQVLVQFTDDLLASLDAHAARAGRSRSQLVRDAVERYLADDLEAEIGRRIVEGYRRIPPDDAFLDRMAEAAAREAVEEEPW